MYLSHLHIVYEPGRERPMPMRELEKSVKSERFGTRLTAAQKELLQRAADLQGRSLSDFVVDSAQRVAEDVIREHEVITLTARAGRAFVESLLNPSGPNARLRAAAERYKQEQLVERER